MMQKSGDICTNCKDHWENHDLEPKALQRVGKTVNKKVIVAVCPYCDGDAIVVYKTSEKNKKS
jgi:hypothetical protein